MRTLLTGWGRTAPSAATLVETGDVAGLLRSRPERGVIARGLGRSYGDAAQNAGGTVLAPIPGPTTVDDETGVVTAAAGTSLHDLMGRLLRERRFVPVTPGTRYVTVGGAVAADIHGKNHHRDGSFGHHVLSLDLVTPDGALRTIDPDREPDLFWATVGGMGLTGVITSVRFRAPRIESAYVTVRTERIGGLDALLRTMRAHDDEYHYSVAWVDTLASGRSLGRSVLTRGDHAPAAELSGGAARHPWRGPADPRLAVPVTLRAVNRLGVRAFNELWFRKAPRDAVGLESLATFFHPLDAVEGWNRLYGRGGLVQYQLVVPDDAEAAVAEALRLLAAAGQPSFLAVLKRFGAAGPGMLSFPQPGWTLALDLPAAPGLVPLFRDLDRLTAEAGGRLYLAKDARMSRELFDRTYPRADEFRALRRDLDPDGVLTSDLARRLDL
ncbi:FAD-binding oxidoreductase [Nocardioides anomalus]|uniref:FAD-binding oxidoreductase n=1 Tax=Nocardioides anomalus TaxID=2712223 RepID=A0A6G6WBC1_9ACTN|nr:FAD-binding oxidoreductase [Nocardioides anomalus]QIG42641.1 FAD-binding oxidoreductase [Nocardioides anomalus]